jgi:hypothetical protein
MANRDDLQKMLDVLNQTDEAVAMQPQPEEAPLTPLEAEQEMLEEAKIEATKAKRDAELNKAAQIRNKIEQDIVDPEKATDLGVKESQDKRKPASEPVAEPRKETDIQKAFKRYKELQEKKPDYTAAQWADVISNLASGLGSVTGVKTTPTQFAKAAREGRKQEMAEQKNLVDLYNTYQKTVGKGSMDVDSPASERARKKYEQMYPGFNFAGLSEAEINGNIKNMIANRRIEDYYTKKIDLGRDNFNFRKDVKHVYKVQEDQEKDIAKFQKDMTLYPTFKESRNALLATKEVRNVLEGAKRGDKTALKTLGVKLAKAFGEKGALSESDVTRYIQSAGIAGKTESAIAEWVGGKLSDSAARSIEVILDDMEKVNKRNVDSIYDDFAEKFSKAEGLDINTARYLLNDPRYRNPGNEVHEEIRTWAKKHKAPEVKPANEVRRRTADSRVAIFDLDTKKFLRWE